MNLSKLENILLNEQKFRIKQVKQAVFVDLIDNWDDVLTLPKNLREKLVKDCPLAINAKNFISQDGKTTKTLLTLKGGDQIEAVLMRHQDRNTVCVSAQVGCPLDCAFCATGKMGFQRNLDVWEIISQVIYFARILKREKTKITNVVFMGMGEPFLNYDNVIGAIRYLNNKDTLGLGARRFSISTSGIIEGIKKLTQEKMAINLALSLHAPNDELRTKLMPVNQKYPLDKVLESLEKYHQKTKRKIMFEYIMIDGINDSMECANQLVKLVRNFNSVVNLIPFNPTGKFLPSTIKNIKNFRNVLEKNKVNVVQRFSFGTDISAACGQLAGKE